MRPCGQHRIPAHAGDAAGGFECERPGVETPRPAELAVEGLRPNPAGGDELTVHFSLASDAPARLELLDVTGRRQYVQDVGALGAGRHSIRISPERRVAPGIYLILLHQEGMTLTRRAAVIR